MDVKSAPAWTHYLKPYFKATATCQDFYNSHMNMYLANEICFDLALFQLNYVQFVSTHSGRSGIKENRGRDCHMQSAG